MTFTNVDFFILGLFLMGLGVYFGYRGYTRYQRKKRSRRAIRGEKRAKQLLKKEGYHILKEQLEGEVSLLVGEKAHACKIRADFYVKKGFKKYIAEVKTGKNAKATVPEIRRQLMEYDLVFKPDGMLFIDMKNETIEVVVFDKKLRHENLARKIGLFCFGFLFGLFMALVVLSGR